jgi:hypothetical protein
LGMGGAEKKQDDSGCSDAEQQRFPHLSSFGNEKTRSDFKSRGQRRGVQFFFIYRDRKLLIPGHLAPADPDRGQQNIGARQLTGKILRNKELAEQISRGIAMPTWVPEFAAVRMVPLWAM